jgi:L-serine dehydratase
MPQSIFDILGPVMIGPSSSHTAGAARIARMAAAIAGHFTAARCQLHGSFAATGTGHGTQVAIAAGLLGIREDDERLRDGFHIAREKGKTVTFETADLGDVHENTVRFFFDTPSGVHTVTGSSVGGGSVLITDFDGFAISLKGELPARVLTPRDRRGVIAEGSGVLARHGVNIGVMQGSRESRGELASMTIECDGIIPDEAVYEIRKFTDVISVKSVPALG